MPNKFQDSCAIFLVRSSNSADGIMLPEAVNLLHTYVFKDALSAIDNCIERESFTGKLLYSGQLKKLKVF